MYVRYGYSVTRIVQELRNKQTQTPDVSAVVNGKRKGEVKRKTSAFFWREKEVLKILTDEIYIGKYYMNKAKGAKVLPKSEWVLVDHKHPAVIDDLTFYKAQEIWERTKHLRAEKKVTTDGRAYLLRGLVECACCYDPAKDKSGQRFIGDRKKVA